MRRFLMLVMVITVGACDHHVDPSAARNAFCFDVAQITIELRNFRDSIPDRVVDDARDRLLRAADRFEDADRPAAAEAIRKETVAVVERLTSPTVEASATLYEDVESDDVSDLRSMLEGLTEVSNIEYVSKTEAFEEFKRTFADSPELWQALPEDSLPARFHFAMENSSVTKIADAVTGHPAVDDFNYGTKSLLSSSLGRIVLEHCPRFFPH
jgi:hypothetical protein